MASRTNMNVGEMGHSYVEWSAVAAGAVLACAVSLVLLQFGNGLGLSVTSIQQMDDITAGKVMVVSLWLFWVQLMASMSGGYLAGRMRAPWEAASPESEIRDGTHGLLVWAVSTLVAVAAATFAGFLTALAQQQGADADMAVTQDTLRRSGIIFGFGLAASSIVAALAAWWMATVGGDHRDRKADASAYFSFRKKKR